MNVSVGEIWKWNHVIFLIINVSIQNEFLTLLVLNSGEWSFLNSGSILSYWTVSNLRSCSKLL